MASKFEFKSPNGYMSTKVWLGAMMLQSFTMDYCMRWLTKELDPCGGMFDQMTQAARSVTANIAEGTSRRQTSRESELKLLDVARASLSELYNDYFFLAINHNKEIWTRDSREGINVRQLPLNEGHYTSDWPHEAQKFIYEQSKAWTPWCNHHEEGVCLNTLLSLTERLQQLLMAFMESRLEAFRINGGFTETLTRERLNAKTEQAIQGNSPQCPVCGGAMEIKIVKKGARQGAQFWGCLSYPNCKGTRNLGE